jgi:hypothetical protein
VHIKRLIAVLGLADIAPCVLPGKVTAAHDQAARAGGEPWRGGTPATVPGGGFILAALEPTDGHGVCGPLGSGRPRPWTPRLRLSIFKKPSRQLHDTIVDDLD